MYASGPNLFDYATSELSQDAFICWLLAWADVVNAAVDPALHALGQTFVRSLFAATQPQPLPGSFSIKIKRQWKKVDIVALIGEKHILAIEDKTTSAEHSDQLVRYRKLIEADYPTLTQALIYLKTGDQSTYKTVEQSGWTAFPRARLLKILRAAESNVRNVIYLDFLRNIQRIEDDSQRYLTTPVNEWKQADPAYRGLYRELQRVLDGEWALVVPPGKPGFLGFWWGFKTIDGGKLYLQIEEKRLVVKLGGVVDATRRKQLWDLWVNNLTMFPRAPSKQGLSGVLQAFLTDPITRLRLKPPKKFKPGKTMTIASADGDWRIPDATGRLDLESALKLLKEFTAQWEQALHTLSSPSPT